MNVYNIDWNTVWKEMHESNALSRGSGDCARMWDTKEQAQKFYQMTAENPERIEKMISLFSLTPDTRVLDIGAGPGSLAIPLTEHVSHVTAVEPARGMVEVMEERIHQNTVSNISIVHKRWEDLSVQDLRPPYDLIIASYSLGMPDIRAAVELMQKVCSGEIWLFWFAGTTGWEEQMKQLWPKIHGKPFVSSPKSDILYNVLYQMGIYPDIRVFDMEHTRTYASFSEAVEEARKQMNCSDEHDELIREFLSPQIQMDDGRCIQKTKTKRVSFNWKVNGQE